jgi:hypothetical protein
MSVANYFGLPPSLPGVNTIGLCTTLSSNTVINDTNQHNLITFPLNNNTSYNFLVNTVFYCTGGTDIGTGGFDTYSVYAKNVNGTITFNHMQITNMYDAPWSNEIFITANPASTNNLVFAFRNFDGAINDVINVNMTIQIFSSS